MGLEGERGGKAVMMLMFSIDMCLVERFAAYNREFVSTAARVLFDDPP